MISMGEHNPIFGNGEESLLSRLADKLFDYLSFYDTFSYVVGISAFAIHKPAKQPEKFHDLLTTLVEESGKKVTKDLANIEVRSKDEARDVIDNIYKELEAQGIQGHLFLRFMVYNVKSQVVSSLHIVDTVCNPCVSSGAVYIMFATE